MLQLRQNRGMISVFLIMILVPCMLVASIFVDISRVWLGRGAAESAADLTLNTLMTFYDYDLSQNYGLMGACQDIDQYYSAMSAYFDQALHSREVEDDEIQLLYQRVTKEIGGRFDNETISDLLRIQNGEMAEVSAVEGAHMRNSAILQKQIVEFMKYRAPIIIVQELAELLKTQQNKENVEDTEESAANKPMMEAQEAYYEAESELLAAANKSYWELRENYTDKTDADGFTPETLRTYAERLKAYRETYEEINGLMIKNLYNTAGLATYTRPNIRLDAHSYSKEDSSISYEAASETADSDDSDSSSKEYRVTASTVNTLTAELDTAIEEFVQKKDALTKAGRELMNRLPGVGDSDAYAIQWWVQMNTKINAFTGTNASKEVFKAGDKMIDAYAKVKAMLECVRDTDVPDSKWEEAQELKTKAEGLHTVYLTKDSDLNDEYLSTVRQLETVSLTHINQIKYTNLSVSVNGSSRMISDALKDISTDLKAIITQLEKYIASLNNVVDGNADLDIPSLQQIRDLIKAYGDKLDTWEAEAQNARTADGKNTEMSMDHQRTIEKIRSGAGNVDGYESEQIVKKIEPEELDALEIRLKNIRTQLEIMKNGIEKMVYGGTPVMDIADYNTFQSASAGQIREEDIPLTNRALNQYAAERFTGLFQPSSGEIAALKDLSDLAYSPVLHYKDDKDNVPALYHQYYQVFKDKRPADVNEKKNELDGKKNEGEERAKNIKNKSRYHGPSGRDLSESEKKADNTLPTGAVEIGKELINTMADLIGSLVLLDITDIRDKLYVTEYIMNMFSYGTFENENYFDLVKEAGKLGDLKLEGQAYKMVYQQAEYKGAPDKEKTWLSERPEDSYNTSLTNEMITADSHYAYQAEIEYILFGANNEGSVKSAYQVIYEIRYFLNLASAFANFWGTSTPNGVAVNAVASTLAAATAFIIPAPLVKAIILPILAVFETGKDMDRLEAGFPVELYKGKDDWWISLPSLGSKPSLSDFIDALSGGTEKIEESSGLRYSDYLTLLVYLGLNNQKYAGGMYQRMADVIEKNMGMITEKEDYSLEKTQVYFCLYAKLRVEPMMLTLPYYSEYVENPVLKEDWCTFEVKAFRGY